MCESTGSFAGARSTSAIAFSRVSERQGHGGREPVEHAQAAVDPGADAHLGLGRLHVDVAGAFFDRPAQHLVHQAG